VSQQLFFLIYGIKSNKITLTVFFYKCDLIKLFKIFINSIFKMDSRKWRTFKMKYEFTDKELEQFKIGIKKLEYKIKNPKPIKKDGLEYNIEFITFLLNFIDNLGFYQVKKLKNDNRFAVGIKYLNKLFEKNTNIIPINMTNKHIYDLLGFTPYTYKINNKNSRGYKFEPDITTERLNNLLDETEKKILNNNK